MKQYCYIDLETSGLSPFKHQLHGVGVAMNNDEPVYYPASAVPQWVKDVVADPTIPKIGSNVSRFDMNFLAHQGWKVAGPQYDTALISMVLDDSFESHGLKQVTARLFGEESLTQKTELDETLARLGMKHVGLLCAADLADPSNPYFNLIGRYCVEDVKNSRQVFLTLKQRLDEAHKADLAAGRKKTRLHYFRDEMTPIEGILLKMEVNGVRVNKSLLEEIRLVAVEEQEALQKQLHELCKDEIARIEADLLAEELATVKKPEAKQRRIDDPAAFDCVYRSTPAQLGRLVYEELGCDGDLVKRGKSGAYTTKEDHLKVVQASAEPESKLFQTLELYFDIKKYDKLISTYTGNDEKGIASLLQERNGETWLFPNYKQRTATGRLSVFPLQQLPGKHKNPRAAVAKKFFIPSTPEHCFVYSDLAAIEIRNAAHLSQDRMMLKMIREGIDPHTTLAARIFKKPESEITKNGVERTVGKEANFLCIFGGEEGKLAMTLALKHRLSYTRQQCKEVISAFRELYVDYFEYLASLRKQMAELGYVTAENGRIRHLPDYKFEKYLNHQSKTFFGPYSLYTELLDHPGQKLRPSEIYYRARGRARHAQNSGYNFPNQSLGSSEIKNALMQLDKEGFVIRACIHDSVIVECLKKDTVETAARVKHIMENCYPSLSTPIASDTKILNSFSESDIFKP